MKPHHRTGCRPFLHFSAPGKLAAVQGAEITIARFGKWVFGMGAHQHEGFKASVFLFLQGDIIVVIIYP